MCFIVLGLVFTGSYWSNSNVASLSGPVVSIQCCCFLLLTLGKINDDDDDVTSVGRTQAIEELNQTLQLNELTLPKLICFLGY